jgi:CBS domain-containing protein
MHQNDRKIKQADKLLKMPGKMDRGPVDFKSHIVEQEGEIMALATRDVISVPPSTTILGAIETMTRAGFRRLPVVDPGSRKLRPSHRGTTPPRRGEGISSTWCR